MKTNLMIHTISRFVFFIILSGAIFLFFAGHNNPGGGFIGGLMTSAALLLIYLSFDLKSISSALPFNYTTIIATGLLISFSTGLLGVVFGYEYLTQFFDYFYIPFFGKTELATAVLFDLGIYLVVIGISLLIILTIGEDE